MNVSAHTGEKMVPVLYCDIDGTIRWGKDELGRFVNGPDDVRVFDEVPDLLAGYKRLGWRIVGISNQGGIALGHMDMQTCVQAMAATQMQSNYAFDKMLWCMHHPDAQSLEMSVCWCRKPKAGMIFEAAWWMAGENVGEIYPPHLGAFVGDRPEDEKCAENAGLRFLPADWWRTGAHLEEVVAKASP
jgi:D-glycero-D-manno-heptose 1,7-bisphosphate phosphatase